MLKSENYEKNKTLLLGTIIYAIGNFGTKFLSFLIVPLYTYYISPSDLGNYDLLCTTINLLTPLLTLQISDAAYRWMINDEKNVIPCVSVTYKTIAINCFITAVLLIVINQFVSIYYCYYFIAILILGRILESSQKLLRGLKRQKLFAVSGILYTAIFVFLNLFFICWLKKGVESLLQSAIISNIITILFIMFQEKRLIKWNLKGDYKKLKKEMLKYSAPLVPTTLNWWIMNSSDRFIIRHFLGSAANGIYAVSYKFPSVLSTIYLMFNNSLTDMVLANKENEKEDKNYYSNVFKKIYILGFSMLLVIVPATKVICDWILSSTYKESSLYISFLYLGTVFQAFSSFFAVGYLKGKKTSDAAKTSIYGAIINIIVNIALINFIGLFAASISTFLGFFSMWIIRVYQTRNIFPIIIDWKKFGFLFLISIAICTITIWTSTIIDFFLAVLGLLLFIFANRKIIEKILIKIKRS